MRICFLAPNYYTSPKKFPKRIFAPRDFAVNLVHGLAKGGHEVCFASAPDLKKDQYRLTGEKNILFAKKLVIDRFLNRPQLTDREAFLSLFLKREYYEMDLIEKTIIFAAQEKFDIIHADHPLVHFFEKFSSVPIVHTIHDRIPRPGTLEYWLLAKYKNHKFISISNNQRLGDLKLNFVGNVYHGLKLKDYPFKNKQDSDYMAFIGRLVPDKGAHMAVRVSHKLKIKLDVATEAIYKENKYYKKEIAPYVIPDKVRMRGFLEKSKESFYQNSKLLIFPIQWEEPFGMVMIEAMACGTPVIAFARGSVPEVVVDGVTGFIVNSSESDKRGDWVVKKTGIDGLCEAVKKIYNMPQDEYNKMRLKCRKRVEENFSVGKMVKGYIEVYRKVLGIK